MKHSIGYKFLVLFVCILSLTALAISTAGTAVAAFEGMYERSFDRSSIAAHTTGHVTQYLAESYLQRYAAETLGQCPAEILDQIYDESLHMSDAKITIFDDNRILASTGFGIDNPSIRTVKLSVFYPSTVPQYDKYGNKIEPAGGWHFLVGEKEIELDCYMSDNYSLTIETELTDSEHSQLQLLKTIYMYRYVLIAVAVFSLLVLVIFFVMLCCTAGRSRYSEEVHAGGLNLMPLDVYAVLVFLGEGILTAVVLEFSNDFFRYSPYLTLPVMAVIVFLAASMLMGALYAFVAQIKTGHGFWWKHCITGWCCTKLGQGLRFLFRGTRAVFRMMPIIWQWLLAIFGLGIGAVISFAICINCWTDFFQMFWLAVTGMFVLSIIGVICYAGYAFGVLMKGVKAMAQGQIYYQIPTSNLFGAFRDFAMQLNAMSGAIQVAVSRQMKSERMKTELITNVSHDIKTPLTSIINYVDLLKKPHDEKAEAQYLDVLDRQSQRLKKLIDDLMEMSKASSGNLSVEFSQINAAEAVNQALGEFGDKLDAAGLIPVFRHPEEPVMINADGRLLWRVLSNILSNAVKYALPNTRLYLDLTVVQGNAVIAIKNISRDQLNVGADELMERFVRGDTSRNTEGSGLGLNIAKSLVELQKGQMHLMVDGDLFKVTLMFPCA